MIVATIEVSLFALLLAVPVALGVAIFLSDFAPRRIAEPLGWVVDLLATIPSVVFGLWGFEVLAPFLQASVDPRLAELTGGTLLFSGAIGTFNLFVAGVVLALMIVPTIAAISRESMRSVPRLQREAALGLGATRWESIRLTVLGPARPGILGAILLGFGRAIGETIAVALLIGGQLYFPTSLFSAAQTIPAELADQVASGGVPLPPLVELGVILLAITVAINVGARLLIRALASAPDRPRRSSHRHGAPLHALAERIQRADGATVGAWRVRAVPAQPPRRRRRRIVHLSVGLLGVLCLLIAIYPLASIVLTAAQYGGVAVVTPSFYYEPFPTACNPVLTSSCSIGGIGPAIQGTLLLLGIASAISIPVGLLAGVYVAEFGRGLFGRSVSFFAEVMTGIPSILISLVVFIGLLRIDSTYAETLLSGGIALSILMIPLVTRTTEAALRGVPVGVREAAIALGFPRHRVTLRVALGTARSGIITGVLLAAARAAGDTAALLFTASWWAFWSPGLNRPVASLAVLIYNNLSNYSTYPNEIADAWGAALVLLMIMVGISLVARLAFPSAAVAEGN
jgi:phosphate ABC transporter permease protein PstC/phosphate ABC transporter permease subunit PstA